MNTKHIVTVLVIVVVAALAYWLFSTKQEQAEIVEAPADEYSQELSAAQTLDLDADLNAIDAEMQNL